MVIRNVRCCRFNSPAKCERRASQEKFFLLERGILRTGCTCNLQVYLEREGENLEKTDCQYAGEPGWLYRVTRWSNGLDGGVL
jgi:hypothetical protein